MANENTAPQTENTENKETPQEQPKEQPVITYTQEQVDSMITQAVDDYKSKNQPDISKYQQATLNAQIETKAVMTAVTMGIDAKALPYVLKLADFKDTANKDGSVSEDKIKSAIDKVLTDMPMLKKSEQNTGFKLGADTNNTNQQSQNDLLKKAFGV